MTSPTVAPGITTSPISHYEPRTNRGYVMVNTVDAPRPFAHVSRRYLLDGQPGAMLAYTEVKDEEKSAANGDKKAWWDKVSQYIDTMMADVMAGLVPAIHVLNEPIVEIIPLGIRREDQTYFPPSRLVLHVLLALDRCADIGMAFREYEPFQSVSLCEALSYSLPMFPDATGKVTGNAGVQCAVWPIGHDVDPSLFHNATLREVGYDSVDGRDKPGHDDKFGAIGAYV